MKLIINILIFTIFYNYSDAFNEPTEKFMHELILNPPDLYKVFWKYNETYITFEVHVKAKGWIGFGISPNGGMANSDVIMAWIKEGEAILEVINSIFFILEFSIILFNQ